MGDSKDKKEKKKVKKPNDFYKITTYNEPDGGTAFERTLYADTNVNQARAIYHQTDPIGDVTAVRWYCLDISQLEDDEPGTIPGTPTHSKTQS